MDWLLGKKASTPSSPSPSQAPPPPPQQPDSSVFQQQAYEAPSIDSLLRPHDPAALHPLANLDKDTLDYIILEDEQIKSAGALPSRGWTDDLCYGTGTTYLAALGLGGIWGVFEALSKQRIASQVHATLNPAVETATLGGQLNASAAAAASAASSASGAHSQAARQSGKLLLNNILNHVTRRGPFLGNSAGVLAMSYNLIDAGIEAWTPIKEPASPLLSGFLAGALFRSTKGPKAMAITGTLVMLVAGTWQGVKRVIM